LEKWLLFQPGMNSSDQNFFVFLKMHQKLSDSNMGGFDSKEWKSVVLPKVYEEKMQKLEVELEKKVRLRCLFLILFSV